MLFFPLPLSASKVRILVRDVYFILAVLAPVDRVSAAFAAETIVPLSAMDRVLAFATNDHVASTTPVDKVVASVALDSVLKGARSGVSIHMTHWGGGGGGGGGGEKKEKKQQQQQGGD